MADHATRQGVEQVAELLVDRFGAEAKLRAELVAFALHEIGESEQAHVWKRIVWAVEHEFQRLNS